MNYENLKLLPDYVEIMDMHLKMPSKVQKSVESKLSDETLLHIKNWRDILEV